MHKRTIIYKDYNDVERTEDFYFNLTKAELTQMELSVQGGLVQKINTMVAKIDGATIMKTFEEIIFKAYGEKSPDGRRFVKSEELSKAFSETEAYSVLFMEVCTNAEAAAAFVNAIVPQGPPEG